MISAFSTAPSIVTLRFLSRVLIILVFVSASSSASANLEPENKFLSKTQNVDRLGVDEAGHLWTWKKETGQATIYLKKDRESSIVLQEFVDLDMDYRYGVVFLGTNERLLETRNWDDVRGFSLKLPFQARGVAWLDSETVLVAPSGSDFVLAAVNLDLGVVSQKMGSILKLGTGPGVVFLRTTKIEPDRKRNIVHALESLSGDYWVFDLESGKTIKRSQVDNLKQKKFKQWFQTTHEEALRTGRTQELGVEWLRLGLDESGQPWTISKCIDNQKESIAHLVRLGASTEIQKIEVQCCVLNMTILNHQVLIAGTKDQEQCNIQEGLPR